MELKGLSDEEVKVSRKRYGNNVVSENKQNSFLSLLIESLGDPIIKILLIALAVKVVFLFRNFDWFETLGILIAIFLAIAHIQALKLDPISYEDKWSIALI